MKLNANVADATARKGRIEKCMLIDYFVRKRICWIMKIGDVDDG